MKGREVRVRRKVGRGVGHRRGESIVLNSARRTQLTEMLTISN
jgi:hypothetical protein